jgi:predicted Holliday junction resolvase-like endonuclease
MSIAQDLARTIIQNADWAMIIVVCFILIVAIVIEHRRLSLLKQEVQRVSDDVKDLAAAEQRRFMQELKLATLKTDKQKSVA